MTFCNLCSLFEEARIMVGHDTIASVSWNVYLPLGYLVYMVYIDSRCITIQTKVLKTVLFFDT